MRVGVVIERTGLGPELDTEALTQVPLNDGVVGLVDTLSRAGLVHTINGNRLNGLVIVSRDGEAAWQEGREALRLAEEDPFALRVLDVLDLRGGASGREQATRKASLLLRAAAAMVREYPWLRPANIRIRLGGLGDRVSRRALLTGPKPNHEVIPAIEEARCAAPRGCDLCLKACPVDAISLAGGSASVDKDRCRDCGLCVSACPTGAADHPFYGRSVLEAGITALLTDRLPNSHDRVIAFACRGAMSTLREVGHRGLVYPAAVLPLEVPSAAFTDLYLVLRAFDLGAAGVAVVSCGGTCGPACQPRAFSERFSAIERVLVALDLESKRLTLVSADSAERLAYRLTVFAEEALALPPHVLCQGPRVPGPAHQRPAAGLLAGVSRRIGIVDALTLEHEGLPFGQPEFDADACSLCGLCAEACPTKALRYSEDSTAARLEFSAKDCNGCRLCSDACSEGALKIARRLEGASLGAAPVALKSAGLRRCRHCGRGYAPEAMISRIMSSLGERASALNLEYCPDCRMTAAMG